MRSSRLHHHLVTHSGGHRHPASSSLQTFSCHSAFPRHTKQTHIQLTYICSTYLCFPVSVFVWCTTRNCMRHVIWYIIGNPFEKAKFAWSICGMLFSLGKIVLCPSPRGPLEPSRNLAVTVLLFPENIGPTPSAQPAVSHAPLCGHHYE